MPTQTYTPIATNTLTAGTTTVSFTSIPATYTDLVLVINAGTNVGYAVRLNGDSGSNYSFTRLYGNGSSAVSDRGTNTTDLTSNWGGGTNNIITVQVMNYSNTTTYKTALTRIGDNTYAVGMTGLWRNTAAVNQVSITASANYGVGSTFTLYGIKAGS
jgi:hypothetical protein